MSKPNPTNISTSVKARLLNVAKANGEELQHVLIRYANERLLYRMGQSAYRDDFVLKGATLLTAWAGVQYRATKDLDFLGTGSSDADRMADVFRQICLVSVEGDGLTFNPSAVETEQVREDERYEGVHIHLRALLGQADLRLQVDIGFGDAITPAPTLRVLPTLLSMPAPMLKCYPIETVIAEKFEAMVDLGIGNSRMKDFYDIWYLARHFDFEGDSIRNAVIRTFERRGTALPISVPLALTEEFYESDTKLSQWQAFVRKSGATEATKASLAEVSSTIAGFLLPIVEKALDAAPFQVRWDHSVASWIDAAPHVSADVNSNV
jgi:predicted nucleotidyltransferase component of viral defense system